MFKNQRHREIVEILKADRFVSVHTLSERLYASEPTIRRDLATLEQQGYVQRNHGGAILSDGKQNPPILFRKGIRQKEKAGISAMAATLIAPGDLIFADASTTASYLAESINRSDRVTVVSNGISLCHLLAQKQICTYSTGGKLFRDSDAYVGSLAERAVRDFYADVFFFSVAALDQNGMVADCFEEENAIRRAMMAQSKRTVLLLGAEKFDSRASFLLCSLEDVDNVVINRELPEELVARFGLTVAKRDDDVILYQKQTATTEQTAEASERSLTPFEPPMVPSEQE